MGAVGGEVDGLIGFDVEGREVVATVELRPRPDAAGQFQVVTDVEELDEVVVIAAELNKGMGPRCDDTAAQLQCLGNRAGRGLPYLDRVRAPSGAWLVSPAVSVG